MSFFAPLTITQNYFYFLYFFILLFFYIHLAFRIKVMFLVFFFHLGKMIFSLFEITKNAIIIFYYLLFTCFPSLSQEYKFKLFLMFLYFFDSKSIRVNLFCIVFFIYHFIKNNKNEINCQKNFGNI